MKAILGILISAVVLYAIYEYRVERVKQFASRQVEKAHVRATESSERARVSAIEAKKAVEEEERRRYQNEKIKVLVKAKDAKKCMKELHTNVIDNQVIECNKDHYIEMRRIDAEGIKEL